jgi:hypothetical protein
MDTIDAAKSFCNKYNLTGIETECRSIIEDEVKYLRGFYKGRRYIYVTLVRMAYDNICRWYEDANSPKIYLSWSSLRQFLGRNRIACVWAVFLGLEVHRRDILSW